MEKLLKAISLREIASLIASSSVKQKISLLPQALMYGESGVDFSIESLSDRSLEVRAKAYELLHGIESQKARNAIAPGLLLNSGDKIYSVYQSEISFSDDGYYLNDSVKYLDKIDILVYGKEYFYDRQEEEFCKSKRLFCYLNKQEAEQKAEALHRKLIQNEDIGGLGFDWGWREQDPTIEQWCKDNLGDKQQDFRYWQNRSNLLDYLYLPENIELLSKFWKDGVGHFAFAEEEYIQQKVYLRIGEKLTERTPEENTETELIARPKGHKQKSFEFLVKAWESDRSQLYLLPEFLKYEDLGIDFLTECLDASELEIRATAYKLLRNVESEPAKKKLALGLLMNPGDRIYSVYYAGMFFTDTVYLLFDYVDDIADLRQEVYGQESCNEEDIMCKCKRMFCYVYREQAEHTAEALHRDFIQKVGVGIGGFEWQKENPNFNVKQWCVDNSLLYKSEWDNLESYRIQWKVEQLIAESTDNTLQEKFNRSKYIYNPEHIDTWCKDNQVDYDRNLNNWDNYRKLLNYLRLPENIELLSKFWKYGVGSFTFVKEEFVRQKVYIKIGEEINQEDMAKELVAKPKEYDRLAIEFLMEISEGDRSEAKHKLKARELLQDIESEYIPF